MLGFLKVFEGLGGGKDFGGAVFWYCYVLWQADNGASPLMCLKGGGITEKQLSHCSKLCRALIMDAMNVVSWLL